MWKPRETTLNPKSGYLSLISCIDKSYHFRILSGPREKPTWFFYSRYNFRVSRAWNHVLTCVKMSKTWNVIMPARPSLAKKNSTWWHLLSSRLDEKSGCELKHQYSQQKINIFWSRWLLSPAGHQACQLTAYRPGVFSQESSARGPQPGILSQESSARNPWGSPKGFLWGLPPLEGFPYGVL